jgi:FkbM family methyltransferase
MQLAGRALRKAGNELLKHVGMSEIWIDVGAHHGEKTLGEAMLNPGLTVYAFEPNLRSIASLLGRAANYSVIPMAIAETDGHAEFYLNAYDQASSLLRMDEDAKRQWPGGDLLAVESVVVVPTIRLDTFMNLFQISSVDFLKIDTQGSDLSVLRSAGPRLRDIKKITLEVDVTSRRLYQGSASKKDISTFMQDSGFKKVGSETQSYGQEENLTFARLSGAEWKLGA